MTIYTAALTLILVMDPLGNIPTFLAILKFINPRRQQIIVLRETLIAFLILVVFLFFGNYIMQGLHLTEPALGIAGGIILFLIAIRMIFPPEKQRPDEIQEEEPFIVPLAVPLIAGPSSIATVLLFATQAPQKMDTWFLAIVLASVIFACVIACSGILMRVLGKRVLIALERLMGMILTTVAVQMFLTGISNYFVLLKK